jgi:pyruvate dehydrogenase E1 component beta subunit
MAVRALQAADELAERGIDAEVIDLRTLRPLDIETVRASVRATGRLLVSHEAPGAVGVGAEVVAGVVESDALDYMLAPVKRVCGRDNPIPYAGNLERATIPQVEDMVKAAAELMED